MRRYWYRSVTVASRRYQAARAMEKLVRKGRPVSPVILEGRTIARTFWGKAWCANLERYSDFSNRLPRGRSYVRNGSVLDLRISSGEVEALVSGSRLYQVKVRVSAVPPRAWSSICRDCVGGIDSLVELLQGRFSKAVMERICREGTGLFPAPAEIKFSCSCPDWASMCKHVAAVLYGTGARLDSQPELLFKLRKVHERDLIAKAGATAPLSKSGAAPDRVLRSDGLAEIFGLEMAAGGAGGEEASEAAPARGSRGSKLRGSTGKAPRPLGKAKPKEVRSSGPKSGKKRRRAR